MKPVSNKCYTKRHDIFPQEYISELAQKILSSPYLERSQLSDNFSTTKGFSVIFKRSALDEVIRHFPFFKPYLQVVIKQACNAFYLNPLVLERGGSVEEHIDCSISSYDMVLTTPNLVSVLYVQVPEELEGGELLLKAGNHLVGSIVPQTNTLVYFLGRLLHSVNKVKCSQPRISLICEQYHLREDRLENIPEFEIKSGAKKYEEIAYD
jgi:predicted 2-oxoglutarate/Fe(II)-dependent dioxygenase YbiX